MVTYEMKIEDFKKFQQIINGRYDESMDNAEKTLEKYERYLNEFQWFEYTGTDNHTELRVTDRSYWQSSHL